MKVYLAAFTLVLLGNVQQVDAKLADQCPGGWQAVYSRCWYYSGHGTAKKWADAEQDCKNRGGRLLSIHTADENDKAYRMCKDNAYGHSCCPRGVCWLGLYQVQGQGGTDFQWLDGTPYSKEKAFWAPGEPNNVGSGGEDCVHNWDRWGSRGKWNDEPCNRWYPYICVRDANCETGYYLSKPYERFNNKDSYATCTLCPAGTYNDVVGAKGLSSCQNCPAGTMGAIGQKSVCNLQCPQGYYCPKGTSSTASNGAANAKKKCPPGTYGPRKGLKSAAECSPCAPGFYCAGNAETVANPHNQRCAAGKCGFFGQTTSTCSQKCPAGYYCPIGSACPSKDFAATNFAVPCGANSNYCPQGSALPISVPNGYYSIGGDWTTRTWREPCEAGYYCANGVRSQCPPGFYRDEALGETAQDCNLCAVGYRCPSQTINTSPKSVNCAPDNHANPETFYCPAGSAVATTVSSGYYTTPRTAVSKHTREAQVQCETWQVCKNGIRSDLIRWAPSTTCRSTGKQTVTVLEMSEASQTLAQIGAQINSQVDAAKYNILYSIKDLRYFDGSEPTCEPDTLVKNKGIFKFIKLGNGNGALQATRNDLNFEVCLPVLEVQYKATIGATITLAGSNTPIHTIDCTLDIIIDDANDIPEFYNFDATAKTGDVTKVYHRQIYEKVEKNVPVAVCDSNGYNFGCPNTIYTEARIPARDEDDASVLTYKIVHDFQETNNDYAPDRAFKIDSCTGLISARTSKKISFKLKQTYKYKVEIKDDGNGGRYGPATDYAIVFIHVMDVNDNPVIQEDPGTLVVPENSPAGTKVLPMPTAHDDDVLDTLSFQLTENDNDAFKIENNQLVTTAHGASIIDFESTKGEYVLKIQVKDNRGGFDSGTFKVTVQDTNDAPIFVGQQVFYVKEEDINAKFCSDPESSCTVSSKVKTRDVDNRNDDKTTFSMPKHEYVQINKDTGVLSLVKKLNFEEMDMQYGGGSGRGFVIQVTATSSGVVGQAPQSATSPVTVYIVDVNEQPKFKEPSKIFSVTENWPIGQVIPGVIVAEDPDNSDPVLLNVPASMQSLSFSIGSTSSQYFDVTTDEQTGHGVLKLKNELDFEDKASHQVHVRVSDNGDPRMERTQIFVVNVLDSNEKPEFEDDKQLIEVAEMSKVQDTHVAVHKAVDPDADTLTYSIIGGNAMSMFDLQSSGAGFQVVQKPDITLNYELSSKEWTIVIQAADEGPSAMIGSKCSAADPESCEGGAFCKNVNCHEKCYDTASKLAQDISHNEFFLCEYNGEAKLPSINQVPTPLYQELAELSFTVRVLDENDAPKISECPLSLTIVDNRKHEDQSLTSPGILDSRTFDEDSINTNSQFNNPYQFTLEENPSFLSITTDAQTGKPYIKYDSAGESSLTAVGSKYTSKLRVSDKTNTAVSSTCQLDIEVIEANTPPEVDDISVTPGVFENTNVPDSSAGEIEVLAKIDVKDDDLDEEFFFSTSPNPYFDVDSKTGRIIVGASAIDYESLEASDFWYILIVQVKDKKKAEDVCEVKIKIRDTNEAPYFIELSDKSLVESAAVGTTITSLKAEDPDRFATDPAWKSLTYSLVGCGSVECPLSVDSLGVVKLTKALNFEGQINSWDVEVKVEDGVGLAATGTFRFSVTDVNEPPKFLQNVQEVSVPEGDLNMNSELFNMLTIVDDEDTYDTPQTMTYSILAGPDAGSFLIENGILKSNNNVVLDFETKRLYELRIAATDTNMLQDVATIKIKVTNVNDVRITGVTGGEIDCAGGTKVTINGENLGLKDSGTFSDHKFKITYTSRFTGVEYDCISPERISANDNSKLRCTTSRGVGGNFDWKVVVEYAALSVSDASPAFRTSNIGYAKPTITDVQDAEAIQTSGGASIILIGTCFGEPKDFPLGFAATKDSFVQYTTSILESYLPTCEVSALNKVICTSEPGVGKEFSWIISSLGHISGVLQNRGRYAAPTVTQLSLVEFESSGTIPGDRLVITGTNFAQLGAVPDPAYAELVYKTARRDYKFEECKVTKAFKEITCTSIEPGMGSDMPVIVGFGDQQSTRATSVVVAYKVPVVQSFSGEGAVAASTTGGQQVIVHGLGFGPSCGKIASDGSKDAVSCDILEVTYSKGSVDPQGDELVYYPPCVVQQGTQLQCMTTSGTGTGHRWSFDFGGHKITFNGATTSYERPTVGAYNGPGSHLANTKGGEIVVIQGSNFGPLNGAPITAWYGPEETPKEFVVPAKSCKVTKAHEEIECPTIEGAGNELKWIVFVDGQESQAEVTDYAPPVVLSFSVENGDVNKLNNDGGDVVTITGSNFGPSMMYVDKVAYGPPGNPFAFDVTQACEHLGHEKMKCTMPTGIGGPFKWTATVRHQTSLASAETTGYISHQLNSLSVLSGGTKGGYEMSLEVEGVGICDEHTSIVVAFGDKEIKNLHMKHSSETLPITAANRADRCPLPKTGNRFLVINVPERDGDADQEVKVILKSDKFSDVLTTNQHTFTYEPPVLNGVHAEPIGKLGEASQIAGCVGDYRVTLVGENFCKSHLCCQVILNARVASTPTLHQHDRIEFCTSEIGHVHVKCGDQKTQPHFFDAESPFIIQTQASDGSKLVDTTYPTLSTGTDQLHIWGIYFGDSAVVLVDGVTVHPDENLEVDCDAVPTHSFGKLTQLDAKCWKVTITVPSGMGRDKPIVVKTGTGDQKSMASNNFEFIHYKEPSVSSVTGTWPTSTKGGEEFTIEGMNFGTVGSVELHDRFRGKSADVVVKSWDHSLLTLEMPPGEGKDYTFKIIVDNQATEYSDVKAHYHPPQIDKVTYVGNSIGNTEGGETVTLTGTNLGRPYDPKCINKLQHHCKLLSPKVSFGGRECEVTGNNHEMITCIVPEGEGKDLSIEVEVGEQRAIAGATFSYAPPVIDSFTPLLANTDGMEDDVPQLMTIHGSNFGVDKLKLIFRVDGQEFVKNVRSLSDDPPVNQFNSGTNHTILKLNVPSYLHKDITLIVEVAGQRGEASEFFAYKKPTVEGVTGTDADGNVIVFDGSEDSTQKLHDEIWPAAPDGERRLQSSDLTTLMYKTSPTSMCERSVLHRGLSWKTVEHFIDTDGLFEKKVRLFEGEMCEAANGLLDAWTQGTYHGIYSADKKMKLSCTVTYSQTVGTTKVTALSERGVRFLANGFDSVETETCCTGVNWVQDTEMDITQCAGQSGCTKLTSMSSFLRVGKTYGLSLLSESQQKLFLSATYESLEVLRSANSYSIPDQPSAVAVSSEEFGAPQGPTSGCWVNEPYSAFLQRRREALAAGDDGLNIYRKCHNKALMTLSGKNFATTLTKEDLSTVEIFFISEDGEEFQAATTTNKGDHKELCTVEDGCSHTHEKVRFQIPPGQGRNLEIKIKVGNQHAMAKNLTTGETIKFHYNSPRVDFVNPGSVFKNYGFQNADGLETVELLGSNFGGKETNVTVLVNGRVCEEPRWRSGAEDEEGQPFLSCVPPKDVVGSKNIFVCVGNQVSYIPAVKSDALLLLEAERIKTGDSDEDNQAAAQLYKQTGSVINARCKSSYDEFGKAIGRMGGLNELCVPCPEGSICNQADSPFVPPKPKQNFFRLDIPVYNSDGNLNERATRRCAKERWDKSFLDSYPGLIYRDTCSDYVSCEPIEACPGGNECAAEYQYAYPKCTAKRSSPGFNNSCGIKFNPFLSTYEGIDSDCNPNPGTTCQPANPEQCSVCTVVYENSVPRGQCECVMPQRCSLCSLNTHFRLNNRCKECPDNPGLLIAMFIILVLLAIFGGYWLNKKKFNLALVAIGVDYFQILAIFASVHIVWPESLRAFFNFLSFFNFNIDIAAPECLVPTLEFETKWWLTEAMPLAVLAMLIVTHCVYTAYKLLRWKKRTKMWSHVSRLIAIFLVIFYFLYLNVTKKALDVFNCNPLPVDDGYLYTSFTSLSCDGGSLCRCGEGIQQSLVPLAVVFLIIYSFGFPIGVFVALRKNKDIIIEDQYLRAHGIGDERETNPRGYETRKRFGQLYFHFKPEKQFWIVFVISRKFLIAFSALMFRGNPTFQLSMILLVLFWAFVMQVQNRPYMSTGERSVVLKELDEKAEKGLDNPDFSHYTGLQKRIQDSVVASKEIERKKKRKKGFNAQKELWGGGVENGYKYAKKLEMKRRAKQYFFDYNTVEAILLASAILVCLSGIMFESGRFENREDLIYQRDSITYTMITIVILTFIYYFLVFFVELFPHASLTRCISCLQKRKPDDHEILDLDSDLKMDDNPMFDPGYVPKGGDPKLETELGRTQAERDALEKQNNQLRSELRKQKKDDQFESDSDKKPKKKQDPKKKKEFTPTEVSFYRSSGTQKAAKVDAGEEEEDVF